MSAAERFDSIARRTLFVPVVAARPHLVLKGTLLLLAFDMWLTRIEQGGRYGVGGFNVAHFAVLDAIQPRVTAGLYLALIIVTGFLCFALAFAPRPPRWLIAITLVLHTWSWSMSMLDSYQHHYLLTLVLLALVFFPRATSEQALRPATPVEPQDESRSRKRARVESPWDDLTAPTTRTTAWAYVALSFCAAIVYGYTAYSKTAREWLSGAAFRRVLSLAPDGLPPPGRDDPIALFRAIASGFGIEGENFWWLMGHSVVLVQIVCCAGFLLAPFRDVARRIEIRIFFWVALATALSFHVGAEVMRLKIGWFSWYMIGYALVYMLPERVLIVLARALIDNRPTTTEVTIIRVAARATLCGVGALGGSWVVVAAALVLLLGIVVPYAMRASEGFLERAPMAPVVASLVLGGVALIVAGRSIDLPGAPAAGILGACALGIGTVALLVRQGNARSIVPYGLSAALGALLFWFTVSHSNVRFDFYRHVGVDHRLRGDPRTAYVAYVKANRYAPEGEDRNRQEQELHDELEQAGQLPRSLE